MHYLTDTKSIPWPTLITDHGIGLFTRSLGYFRERSWQGLESSGTAYFFRPFPHWSGFPDNRALRVSQSDRSGSRARHNVFWTPGRHLVITNCLFMAALGMRRASCTIAETKKNYSYSIWCKFHEPLLAGFCHNSWECYCCNPTAPTDN